MIQVRVAQQSAVSVRIAGAAPVRVDVTGTAAVSAPEYSGPYDITPLFTAPGFAHGEKTDAERRDNPQDTAVRGIQRFKRLHTDNRR